MVLRRLFFRPKWQHRDPSVRREALQALDPGDPQAMAVLVEAARHDQEPELRRLAVRRLVDPDLLEEIARSDVDASVCEQASVRFCQVLSGQADGGPELAERLRLLVQSNDPRVIEHVLRNGRELELRRAALSRVGRDSLRGDVAVDDPELELRLEALEQVEQASTLERVLRSTRLRDKHISRRARERLDELTSQAERQANAARRRLEICATLEQLATAATWQFGARRIEELAAEWEALPGVPEAELLSRYVAARESASQASEARRSEEERLAPIRSSKLSLCETLERALAELGSKDELAAGDEAALDSLLRLTETSYLESGALPEAEERELRERFERVRASLQERRSELVRMRPYLAHVRSLCSQAEALLKTDQTLGEGDLRRLEERADAVRRPKGSSLAADQVEQLLATRMGDLRVRAQTQQEAREAGEGRLRELVDSAEQALASGEVSRAEKLVAETEQLLTRLLKLGSRRASRLEGRVQKAAARLRELEQWRRWADTREKERLCEEVEALLGREGDLEETAASVRAARAAWKRLGRGEAGSERVLWERFDRACTTAYAPCQAFFEQQSQERKENLERREALCAGLEEFLASTDWTQIDWRDAERFAREIGQQWRTLGPVDRRRRPQIEGRFRAAYGVLEARLGEERERNQRSKESLVQQAEGLAALEDLRQAVRRTKELQREWKTIGPAARRKEQQLWKRFRAACDVVFARRQEEQEARERERAAGIEQRESLCAEAEALLAGGEEALASGAEALQRLQDRWRQTDAVAAERGAELEQRFRSLCQELGRRLRWHRIEQARAGLASLRDKAALCAQAEALVAQASDRGALAGELAQLGQSIEPPAGVDDESEAQIRQRFAAARALADQDQGQAGEALEREHDRRRRAREDLCVRIELLAGVDSPPEAERARLQHQVERLSEVFGGGSGEKGTDAARLAWELERDWILLEPCGSGEEELLRRFEAARDTFYGKLRQA